MSSISYAAAVLGLASAAYGQSSCGSRGTTTTINAVAEITACSTYSGSIALATGTSGDIDFGSLESITGDLVSDYGSDDNSGSEGVTSLSGSFLRSIGGSFRLVRTLALNNINFPQLNSIDNVHWDTVPQLQTLALGSGTLQINDFLVVDSLIQDLSGIRLTSARSVALTSNNRLIGLNWPTRNITGEVRISSNGIQSTGFNVQFPNLLTAGLLNIDTVSNLDLPMLSNASGVIVLDSSLRNVSLPNLTMIGADGLRINNNAQLSELNLPELKTVGGGVNISQNAALDGALQFPQLTRAANLGAYGSFSNLSLPKINTISGTVTVKTTDQNFNCRPIDNLANGVTDAKVDCTAGDPNAANTNGGTGTGGSNSHTSTGAAIANGINLGTASLFGATGLFAVMFGMI